jgi:3-isopropylmalate/(R)-2-methylmalate dehydratase large subunit
VLSKSASGSERSDPDAEIRQRLRIDLSALEPLVALPHLPGNVVRVSDAGTVLVDQVYIGNCANGTMTDLRQAASILGGRRVHPRTRAIVSTPTCGACFGVSNGILAPGENAVATTNRNFRGRMGSPDAGVYLANAWVAAAAAVAGELIHPREIA